MSRLGWREGRARMREAVDLVSRALRGEEHAQFHVAAALAKRVYPRYVFGDFGRSYLYDEAFLRFHDEHVGEGYTLDRKYALDQLLKLVKGLPGDTVECGAFRGASSYLICRRVAGQGRRHHVFDSFEGLSTPGREDGSWWRPGDLSMGEDVVRKTLREFDFVDYHRGWIPDRFPDVADRTFAFVHIDVDLYQPTRACLEFFYERVVPGGLIVADDYGFTTCPGATRAVDEFMEGKAEPVVCLPSGQGLVFKR